MDTTQSITLSQAFAHCASTSSYWVWIGIALVVDAVILILLTKANNKAEVNPMVKMLIYFFCLAFVMCSIFIRPCNVHVNTSVEMAKRGHYLGY